MTRGPSDFALALREVLVARGELTRRELRGEWNQNRVPTRSPDSVDKALAELLAAGLVERRRAPPASRRCGRGADHFTARWVHG